MNFKETTLALKEMNTLEDFLRFEREDTICDCLFEKEFSPSRKEFYIQDANSFL